MKQVRTTLEELFRAALAQAGAAMAGSFPDDFVLLESGLDSLGFAILITRLDQELGYDPFSMTDEAVYPTTFGQLVTIYERFAPDARP